jgi:hypothetical protein
MKLYKEESISNFDFGSGAKEEIKMLKKLKQLKEKLSNMEINDKTEELDDILYQLSQIDIEIEGIDLDFLWLKAWDGIADGTCHLPHERCNHGLVYIQLIEEEIKELIEEI